MECLRVYQVLLMHTVYIHRLLPTYDANFSNVNFIDLYNRRTDVNRFRAARVAAAQSDEA